MLGPCELKLLECSIPNLLLPKARPAGPWAVNAAGAPSRRSRAPRKRPAALPSVRTLRASGQPLSSEAGTWSSYVAGSQPIGPQAATAGLLCHGPQRNGHDL